MKGVVLAGGSGSRMRPMTEVTSKAMVTVYDRPAIKYHGKFARLNDV